MKALKFLQLFAFDFMRSVAGNMAVTFALLLPLLLVGAGLSVDYLRAYGSYSEMQAELDLALIAAIKQIDNLNSDEIETVIENWFGTQTRVGSFTLDDVAVDIIGSTISATARARVPTTLMQIAGIDSVPVSVNSAVAGPATSYLNVYLVLDKSASMLLASNAADQTKMTSALGCAFACHLGETHTVAGKKYDTNYAYSSAHGVELRTDVLLHAVHQVLDTVQSIDPSGSRIKVGLYRIATTAATTLAPTFDINAVRATLDNPAKLLTSATSTDGTFFNIALNALTPMVGTSGNGTSANSPLKLVMMITDGVQSERSWVAPSVPWEECIWNATPSCAMSEASRQIGPLNPAWCNPIKNNGPTLATVYTTYLPVTSDWGYNGTLGATMASSVWSSKWGGVLRSGVSPNTTRRDYLPIALGDCATSAQYFMQATSDAEIKESLATLFKRYLSSVRLTR